MKLVGNLERTAVSAAAVRTIRNSLVLEMKLHMLLQQETVGANQVTQRTREGSACNTHTHVTDTVEFYLNTKVLSEGHLCSRRTHGCVLM